MGKLGWALLLASATMAGVPALAAVQDQPPEQQGGHHDDGHHDHGHGQPGGSAPADHGSPNTPGGQGGYSGRGAGGDHDRQGGNPNGSGPHGWQGDRDRNSGPHGWQGDDRNGHGGDHGWQDGRDRGSGPHGWQGGDRDGHGGDGDWRSGSYGPGPHGWQGDAHLSGWRNDPRYDWHGWRQGHGGLFHGPRYLPPRGYGYGYRAFAPGYRLQPFFYAQNYWITDPWTYRLPPADGPYRWIRYYNDVLLVDLRSGIVVDAIQSFFL